MKVLVSMEVVDVDHIDGLCTNCLLPGLIRLVIAVRNDFSRPGPSGLTTRIVCHDCGEPQ